MSQPLVLAIEPDLRQAAIVKRIVREKVLADVTVVDSRDAALEAMRMSIPDVLLLSALLSPRDEDELFAHLRTLQHTEHLQTHTIPQLASTIGPDDKQSKGLLSAFRRKKASAGTAPAGCDPDLFADEIRTYLQRAEAKKREIREAGANPILAAAPLPPRPATAARPADAEAAAGEPVASSWESPFEWRPTRSADREVKAAPPAAAVVRRPEPIVVASPEFVDAPEPVVVDGAAPGFDAVAPVSIVAAADHAVEFTPPEVLAPPEPEALPEPDPIVVAAPSIVAVPEPEPVDVPVEPATVVRFETATRAKPPLEKRHAREWWFETAEPSRLRGDAVDSELREVLASLSVPFHVAAMSYAEGCRIRRVRLIGD